eukprot:g5776.t1
MEKQQKIKLKTKRVNVAKEGGRLEYVRKHAGGLKRDSDSKVLVRSSDSFKESEVLELDNDGDVVQTFTIIVKKRKMETKQVEKEKEESPVNVTSFGDPSEDSDSDSDSESDVSSDEELFIPTPLPKLASKLACDLQRAFRTLRRFGNGLTRFRTSSLQEAFAKLKALSPRWSGLFKAFKAKNNGLWRDVKSLDDQGIFWNERDPTTNALVLTYAIAVQKSECKRCRTFANSFLQFIKTRRRLAKKNHAFRKYRDVTVRIVYIAYSEKEKRSTPNQLFKFWEAPVGQFGKFTEFFLINPWGGDEMYFNLNKED